MYKSIDDNPNVERVSDWVEMDGGLGRACIVMLDFSKAKLDRFENE